MQAVTRPVLVFVFCAATQACLYALTLLCSQLVVALAREIGVHPQTALSWINSGTRPQQEILPPVSAVMHMLLGQLLEGAGYLVTA